MTIKEAVRRADELRPNALGEEQKAAWVWEAELRFAELRGETEGTCEAKNPWPEDGALFLPPPWDGVYELYLCAMIDHANQETDQYANDVTMFNSAFAQAAAWWRRGHEPRGARGWEVGL